VKGDRQRGGGKMQVRWPLADVRGHWPCLYREDETGEVIRRLEIQEAVLTNEKPEKMLGKKTCSHPRGRCRRGGGGEKRCRGEEGGENREDLNSSHRGGKVQHQVDDCARLANRKSYGH